MPGGEYLRLTRALLRHAGPHLQHCWLSLSGAAAADSGDDAAPFPGASGDNGETPAAEATGDG